jgi:hypothetical protein
MGGNATTSQTKEIQLLAEMANGRMHDSQPNERGTMRGSFATIGCGTRGGGCLTRGIDYCATGGSHGVGVPADRG